MKNETAYNPLVSIIIPVRNGESTLDICLRSVKRSYYKNYEIIVVNDHSHDNTVSIAQCHNCTVLHAGEKNGANYSRNLGAQHATGDILLFLDSDVRIDRDTILEIVETLDDENLDAVVGVYTTKHRHENLVSQYKNLWIRYSYMKSTPAIDWLFGAVSGIKRPAFDAMGGFNNELHAVYGNDDIELGKRFSQNKLNIMLNLDIEVEHMKNYTLRSFIKNEYRRSVGFAELATRLGEATNSVRKGFVNVYPEFVLSTIISILLIGVGIGIAVNAFSPWYLAGIAFLYLVLNIRFLNYLEQVRGLFAMIVMSPILLLDHLVCFFGSVVGVIKGWTRRKQ